MNNKRYIYILLVFGCLITSACARNVVEKTYSPEERAIELAKECVVVDDKANGLKMSAREAILTWEKEPEFTPVGWEAIDVDESIYFVVYNYRVNNINQLWAFHVVLEGNTVERIELGGDGLDGDRYMSRIISMSSYSREVLQVKLKKVIEKLLFQ